MLHKNQQGSLVVPLILAVVLLLGSLGFGFWAFVGMQDYKNNSDQKVAEAVEAAVTQNSLEKEAEFTEASKSPYKTFTGPSAYGSLKITYPKTWSAYIDQNQSVPLDGYVHPDFVPAVDEQLNYALRFEITDQSYDNEMQQYTGQVETGALSSAAYRPAKVSSVLGSKLTGSFDGSKSGTMVVLPLRDKTIKVWTESSEFTSDFNKVLETLTFVP